MKWTPAKERDLREWAKWRQPFPNRDFNHHTSIVKTDLIEEALAELTNLRREVTRLQLRLERKSSVVLHREMAVAHLEQSDATRKAKVFRLMRSLKAKLG